MQAKTMQTTMQTTMQQNTLKVGSTAYIVENNLYLREVTILRIYGNTYIVKFKDGGGAIRLHRKRLFETEEEAKANKRVTTNKKSNIYLH